MRLPHASDASDSSASLSDDRTGAVAVALDLARDDGDLCAALGADVHRQSSVIVRAPTPNCGWMPLEIASDEFRAPL